MSSPFGSPFGQALAQAGPAAGPALQAAGAAASDPHATAMSLAVAAARATTAQAAAAGVAAAAGAARIAAEAAAGLRPASDAVAAAAALPPPDAPDAPAADAAWASDAVAAGIADIGQQFSPSNAAGAPEVSSGCTPTPAATSGAQEIVWPPNRGFDGDPVPQTLLPGTTLSRYGGWFDANGQFQDKGTFVAPEGVPYSARALAPGTDAKPHSTYEVLKPIENVPSGPAAPWFGEPGGGIQHELPMSINQLLEGGFIRATGRTPAG